MATKYPESVKGLHYRVSNKWRYLTVSFVLERNLTYPDLGFNFTETQGQGVVYSSQLCFLTKQDAENFIEKYGIKGGYYETDYRPFISRDTTTPLIRIDAGGGIPCYTSKYCCEHYENRISNTIKARLEMEPVSNPFAGADPDIQAAAERDRKKREEGELQSDIIEQVLQSFGAQKLEYRYNEYYAIPLNLDSNVWANYDRYHEEFRLKKPSLLICVYAKGAYSKKLMIHDTHLSYLPLLPLYKEEMKSKSSWNRDAALSPFWKNLFKAEKIELESNPIVKLDNDSLGIQVDSYYSRNDSISLEWTPGKRNNVEKLTGDIKKIISFIEEAAKAFEKVANEFDEEDTIE